MTANLILANYLEEERRWRTQRLCFFLVPYAGIIQIRYNGIHISDLSLWR